ncbi:hypothetical protein U9M48_039366 [Paspalum notatum var. saurae]|uniref:Uncharacterized protein n=1 Tax=Paspalum notatum var. saurae TaxID=547442 RepID=A0AAQ3UL86_PASNO
MVHSLFETAVGYGVWRWHNILAADHGETRPSLHMTIPIGPSMDAGSSGSFGSGAFPSPFFSFFSFFLFGSSLAAPSSPRPRGLALPRPRLLRYSPSSRSLSRRSLLLERLLFLPRKTTKITYAYSFKSLLCPQWRS